MSPGTWHLQLWLWTTPTSRLFDLQPDTSVLTQGYLWEVWSYFDYPTKILLSTTVVKHATAGDGLPAPSSSDQPQCRLPAKGEWRSVHAR